MQLCAVRVRAAAAGAAATLPPGREESRALALAGRLNLRSVGLGFYRDFFQFSSRVDWMFFGVLEGTWIIWISTVGRVRWAPDADVADFGHFCRRANGLWKKQS